ncbi:MAG: type II toxin-antitoxin system PemK/MazF family toxin [Candidatus Binatia bacterium]
MATKPGDVWLGDLRLAAKTRPVVILSRDDPQAPRGLVVYVPLTTQNRGSRYEVELGRPEMFSDYAT